MNPATDQEEKKFVRNVRYMFPKSRQAVNKNKTKIQPRELFDLTEDAGEAVVKNLCDVINLDDSDYNIEAPKGANFQLNFKPRHAIAQLPLYLISSHVLQSIKTLEVAEAKLH